MEWRRFFLTTKGSSNLASIHLVAQPPLRLTFVARPGASSGRLRLYFVALDAGNFFGVLSLWLLISEATMRNFVMAAFAAMALAGCGPTTADFMTEGRDERHVSGPSWQNRCAPPGSSPTCTGASPFLTHAA